MSADGPRVADQSPEELRAIISALRHELVACQRLALLGSLAAMIAHEYNNLLTPIIARVEAALSMPDDVQYMRKTLERTLLHSQRAVSISKNLLEMAHDQHCPIEQCSVAAAVREAIETMIRPLDKDNIHLHVDVPDNLHVNAREDLLCQVLLNLLLNARRAMNGGGTLSITALHRDGCAQIDVRDSGKGIPRELLDTVFNRFLAADPSTRPHDWQQVGLGLSVCRMITHQHGASLRALPNEGPGCTFRLCWPLAGGTDLPS